MEAGRTARWRRPRRSVWTVVGTVLAVLLGIGGLAAVGVIVLAFVALNNYGSNK